MKCTRHVLQRRRHTWRHLRCSTRRRSVPHPDKTVKRPTTVLIKGEDETQQDEASVRGEPTHTSTRPTCSVIALHGFGSTGDACAERWMPRFKAMRLAQTRLIFVTAPTRAISCYGETCEHAWHDYLTDYGGTEGRPDLEEVINAKQLARIRGRIHQIICSEAEAYYEGNVGRVALFGESQGGCVALDAALTMSQPVAGVWSSFGMLYTCTPIKHAPENLRICAFHGAKDDTIAAELAVTSYARLSNFTDLSIHVAPGLNHCQSSTVEIRLLRAALRKWGFQFTNNGLKGAK